MRVARYDLIPIADGGVGSETIPLPTTGDLVLVYLTCNRPQGPLHGIVAIGKGGAAVATLLSGWYRGSADAGGTDVPHGAGGLLWTGKMPLGRDLDLVINVVNDQASTAFPWLVYAYD